MLFDTARTRSSQEASSKTNNLVRLRMLKRLVRVISGEPCSGHWRHTALGQNGSANGIRNVNFVVDVRSDDFVIYSVHLDFAQTHKCPMEAMPKLLEWVKPNYRREP